MDGFLVIYVRDTKRWYTKSLQLHDWEYDLMATDQDLTYYQSSWKWNCEVEILERSELVTCTRKLPLINDWETGEIMYIPQIVVNNIGYVWKGSEAGYGSYEFGGQVTLNSAVAFASGFIYLCFFTAI